MNVRQLPAIHASLLLLLVASTLDSLMFEACTFVHAYVGFACMHAFVGLVQPSIVVYCSITPLTVATRGYQVGALQ